MKELKDYLDKRYPPRFSWPDPDFFSICYIASLLVSVAAIFAILDVIVPGFGTDVFIETSVTSTVLGLILVLLVSCSGAAVMSYMIYKRRQKRSEASKLIYRYVHQKSREKDIAELAKEARFIDEVELFELINGLSKTDILENL